MTTKHTVYLVAAVISVDQNAAIRARVGVCEFPLDRARILIQGSLALRTRLCMR